MEDDPTNSTTIYTTTRCRGRQNFSSHCTDNGPSKAVWIEIMLVGIIIFGLFWCYVRWSDRKRELEWITWNDDSSDEGSTKQGYVYMHPDPRKKNRRGSWLSRLSSRRLSVDLSSLYPKWPEESPQPPTDDQVSKPCKGEDAVAGKNENMQQSTPDLEETPSKH